MHWRKLLKTRGKRVQWRVSLHVCMCVCLCLIWLLSFFISMSIPLPKCLFLLRYSTECEETLSVYFSKQMARKHTLIFIKSLCNQMGKSLLQEIKQQHTKTLGTFYKFTLKVSVWLLGLHMIQSLIPADNVWLFKLCYLHILSCRLSTLRVLSSRCHIWCIFVEEYRVSSNMCAHEYHRIFCLCSHVLTSLDS